MSKEKPENPVSKRKFAGQSHYMRGGSWREPAWKDASYDFGPSERYNFNGLRIARTVKK